MIDKVKTGMNIMQKAKEKGMNQKMLSVELGVDANYVNRWVNGKILPTLHFMLPLSRILGCSMEELLVESEEDY